MKEWSKIYLKKIDRLEGPKKYLQYKVREKEIFIKKILFYAGPNGKVLEAGCGTGVISTYLSNCGLEVTAVDIDEDMLKVARKISKQFSQKPGFKRVDLFKSDFPVDYYDLVFSHGVLEHFSDKQIITLIKKQLRMSKTLIFSVPSNYLSNKDRYYGNERFLSVEKWKRLISKTNSQILETFGFHYIIGWRKYWDTLVRGKVFGPPPYITFVLKKR